MSGNKLGRCGWMIAAMVALSSSLGWAQEPVVSDPATAPAEPVAAPAEPVEHAKIAPSYVEPETTGESGSWMIGTRIIHFELQDDTRGTKFNNSFMGSITEIKDEQDYTPDKVFVQYRIVKSPVWVGITYDHVRAETQDEGGTDGSVDIGGWIPYVQGRWENETIAVPYIELGFAFYRVRFEESEGWSNDGDRYVALDHDVMGMEIAGGVSLQVYEGLSVDLYARYMDIDDINGTYYIGGNPDGDAVYTMSYIGYGIGVQYQF